MQIMSSLSSFVEELGPAEPRHCLRVDNQAAAGLTTERPWLKMKSVRPSEATEVEVCWVELLGLGLRIPLLDPSFPLSRFIC